MLWCKTGSWCFRRSVGTRPADPGFDAFFRDAEPRLRRALTAANGPVIGREAAADALAYAWQHWDRVGAMEHPIAYLFRVGQSSARRHRRPLAIVRRHDEGAEPPWVEPALAGALADLSDQQRVAVVLCHGFGWTHQEVADLLDLKRTTVQNHVERGLAKLRSSLEVTTDV
jgi:RNA polymerase sigma factor (sigma-70 family)